MTGQKCVCDEGYTTTATKPLFCSLVVSTEKIFSFTTSILLTNYLKQTLNPNVAIKYFRFRGLVSKETVVLRRWGSDTRKFGLSTELIM